jgi:hypothetical protein
MPCLQPFTVAVFIYFMVADYVLCDDEEMVGGAHWQEI